MLNDIQQQNATLKESPATSQQKIHSLANQEPSQLIEMMRLYAKILNFLNQPTVDEVWFAGDQQGLIRCGSSLNHRSKEEDSARKSLVSDLSSIITSQKQLQQFLLYLGNLCEVQLQNTLHMDVMIDGNVRVNAFLDPSGESTLLLRRHVYSAW